MGKEHHPDRNGPMTRETMTDIEIRISSLKGVPPATLSRLDEMFEKEFGQDKCAYSDPDWFVMGFVGDVLVSRIGILRRVVTVGDDVVVVGGVSGVTTQPEHRHRGYATMLMKSAQKFMREELPADFGLLICNAMHRAFYERLGWKNVPGPTVYAQPGGTETCKGLTMTLELGRAAWPAGAIDLCGFPW
jgi:GNAT superfamily N-acetyltransferase